MIMIMFFAGACILSFAFGLSEGKEQGEQSGSLKAAFLLTEFLNSIPGEDRIHFKNQMRDWNSKRDPKKLQFEYTRPDSDY
jgi:hypothetical protein